MQKITKEKLKKIIKKTTVLPDYMKNIYLEKINSKRFSNYFCSRIFELISQLESRLNNLK